MKLHGCEVADTRTAIPRRAGNLKNARLEPKLNWKTDDEDNITKEN